MLKNKKKTPIKNLIIFAPFIENGGIEKNLVILTEFLSSKINEIILITWKKEDKKYFNKNVKVITPNKSFFKFSNRSIKNLVCLLILIKLLILSKKRLIFSFQSNLYVTIVARFFQVNNIIRIASYNWMRRKFKKFIFKIILKYPSQIIVNSYEMKKCLKKDLNINSKCIYNPLNLKEINRNKKTKRNHFTKDKKKMKILFLGRFVDQKDPFTFLYGIKNIDKQINYQALMVGEGYMKKNVAEFIFKNNLSNKIKLIKYNSHPMQYLNQCDLLVLTSKYEGLPNVLLEAQYLKKYIISTDCKTGPREILNNGKYGDLFKVGDYKSLKKKIEFFYFKKKSKYIKKKIDMGFLKLNRFDYDKCCNKYLSIINRYIKND